MEDFDIAVKLSSRPDCEGNESLDEERLRENEVDPNIETIDDIVDYSFLVKVFYWYLNRQPREPSNI
ncbi:hypothetical protein NYO67_12547 [Aspergillus flavus]|nr:hypothetical protein NYO67_12547 [Aspergillus flavus]